MDNVMADDVVALKRRIADLENQLAVARAEAQSEFRRGFDRAFAMGVNSFSALWSEIVKSVSPIRNVLADLDRFADEHFDTVDGRSAEERGGGTLADAPVDAWDRYDHGMSPAARNAALAESPAAAPKPKPKRQSRRRS